VNLTQFLLPHALSLRMMEVATGDKDIDFVVDNYEIPDAKF
jgi:hypothetical protein